MTKDTLAKAKEIEEQINQNIILRYAYSEGVIANSLSKDKEIQEAVKILADKEAYKHIVTKQDTERK